jgi:hypothetical protein
MASMASELLKNLAQALTPPPPPPLDDEYDGLEYSWKYFVFRPACESIHSFRSTVQLNTSNRLSLPVFLTNVKK